MTSKRPKAVKIFLLGRFEVELDGRSVSSSAWKRRRPVELLAALALASGHVLHREEAIDRFWPDKDLEAGANNLYRAVHDLRKIVGNDAITFDRGVVGLANDVWVDVDEFDRGHSSHDAAALEAALGLYHGVLLPDDPYSDALETRRESLRQRFVDGGLRLADLHDDDQKRIEMLRRVVEVDPTLERAHRALMSALAKTGRRRDASRQFAECVKALREHLEAEPAAETRRLHERIQAENADGGGVIEAAVDAAAGKGAQRAASPADTNATIPRGTDWKSIAKRLLGSEDPPALRGRSDALDQIRDFATRSNGALLLIGEAGVGKTRLAVEAARTLAERGACVLAGMGYDFEGTAPYTPFVDAWSDHARRHNLSGDENPFLAFHPTPGASAQEDRLRLFQTIERAVKSLAGDGVACVVIEDAHQADESSLLLIHHLARAASHLPLVLVATLREEAVRVGTPLHTLLAGLNRERLAERIELTRLDRAGTREIVADLSGGEPDDAIVNQVFELSEGNPFYTEEVFRALEAGKGQKGPPVPDDVLETIRQRVTSLGRDAERLLIAASAVGQRFDFDVVREVTGLGMDEALESLDAGIDGRVVEEDGQGYRFRHALTRQALYGSLTHARRVYLHRSVADALEKVEGSDTEAAAEILAFHHQAAGQLERALPFVLTAAKRAQERLGFSEAIGFYDQALEMTDALGEPPDAKRFEVMCALGGMSVALGNLERAVRELQAAAAIGEGGGWRPSRVQRARALRLAGLALIEGGELEKAETSLDGALALLDEEPDAGEMASLLYLYSQLRWHQSRHQDAYEMAERCLTEAERTDDSQAIAKGYEMLALACHSLGEWRKGTEFEERRQSLADGSLDVASAFDVHL